MIWYGADYTHILWKIKKCDNNNILYESGIILLGTSDFVLADKQEMFSNRSHHQKQGVLLSSVLDEVIAWTGPDLWLQQYPVVVSSKEVWQLRRRCTCSSLFLLGSGWTWSGSLLVLLQWVQIALKGWQLRHGQSCSPWWPEPWVVSVLESPTEAGPTWQ